MIIFVDLFNHSCLLFAAVWGLRIAMQQLYEDLLFNYMPEVRPSEHLSDVTLVYFSAFLIQILDLVSSQIYF